jgi:hypothetical protein
MQSGQAQRQHFRQHSTSGVYILQTNLYLSTHQLTQKFDTLVQRWPIPQSRVYDPLCAWVACLVSSVASYLPTSGQVVSFCANLFPTHGEIMLTTALYAMSPISVRFWGWSENKHEEERDFAELSQLAREGKPLYGESPQPQWVQNAAYSNSAFSQLKFSTYLSTFL